MDAPSAAEPWPQGKSQVGSNRKTREETVEDAPFEEHPVSGVLPRLWAYPQSQPDETCERYELVKGLNIIFYLGVAVYEERATV